MNEIAFRDYQETDFDAVKQIWIEVGWLSEGQKSTLKDIIRDSRVTVGTVNNNVEASAMCTDGALQYLDTKINASLVDAVTVSLIARKQGLAGRALALQLAKEYENGYPISFLGMFEQGFYNKLGYGTGSYYHQVHLDPADLNVPYKCRIPRRLTQKDYKIIHKNRLERMKLHGRFDTISEIATKSEMDFMKKSFGLGYFDDSGKLTHHLWLDPKDRESGPYRVVWQAYETHEQFLELMALVQSMGDQVRLVDITEPADIQISDFIKKPIRGRGITNKGNYQVHINSYPYWQFRMLDPIECIRQTHLNIDDLEFNLELEDPIEKFLDNEKQWNGCSGKYYVKLGRDSRMEPGFRDDLPLLKTDIGSFSRMWLGVKPASGLSVSGKIIGDAALKEKLDIAFRLPDPQPDWWY